jgi:hypothetical protein
VFSLRVQCSHKQFTMTFRTTEFQQSEESGPLSTFQVSDFTPKDKFSHNFMLGWTFTIAPWASSNRSFFPFSSCT